MSHSCHSIKVRHKNKNILTIFSEKCWHFTFVYKLFDYQEHGGQSDVTFNSPVKCQMCTSRNLTKRHTPVMNLGHFCFLQFITEGECVKPFIQCKPFHTVPCSVCKKNPCTKKPWRSRYLTLNT